MRQAANMLSLARDRGILWSPLALMAGICVYFNLSNEPPPYLGASLLAIVLVVRLVLRQHDVARSLSMICMLMVLGFFAAQWRTQHVATALLVQEMHNRQIEGTVEEIDPVEQKEKLVLSNLVIEHLLPEQTPLRVRISFRRVDPAIRVGDRVSVQANLFPLPSPVMPGSYDFARHFYFLKIGGNGFALRPADIVSPQVQTGFYAWLNNLRHTIGENMRQTMPGAIGSVAAAMTVGETGPIPEATKAALRNSGLAHMLAIAGLHLGIVAGIIFFSVRLLLVLYPRWALRLPVKKIAAIFALAGAGIYLLLAGCPIPAQRAFIMVAFLFGAMLLDRRGITLRTLALAADFILVMFPESLFGPSFQMSFAATLAIVALFERGGNFLRGSDHSWRGRAWHHLLGIIATSLVATMATAPFVLYHFNRFALFGLLSNMIVVPLATFVIMPGMVISLLLMPLGLQEIGYIPLQYGTLIMLHMANWVTHLPYSSLYLASPSDIGLCLCALGLLWFCLMLRRRWMGLFAIAAGLGTIALHVAPDMIISDDGRQVMARLDDGHYTLLKGTNRSFTAQSWLRAEGQEEIVPLKSSGITCDEMSCLYRKEGHSVLYIKKSADEDFIAAKCQQLYDLMIAWYYIDSQSCSVPTLVIGRRELEMYGAHAVFINSQALRITQTRKPENGHRPWHPILVSQEDDSEEAW